MKKVIATTIILKCLNPMCTLLLKGSVLDESQRTQISAITVYGYQLALISQLDSPEVTKESSNNLIFNCSTCVHIDDRCLADYFDLLTYSNKRNTKQMEYIEKAAQVRLTYISIVCFSFILTIQFSSSFFVVFNGRL